MVGTGRFELPTCRLGGDRSIQSELRARNTYIVASKAFVSNVGAIVHARETDLLAGLVRFLDGASQILPRCGHAKNAAARRFEPTRPGARARVTYGCAGG